jgi:alpha-beta hydrolase superfamily lysophospholipase
MLVHRLVIDTDPLLLAAAREQDLQGHGMSKSASNEPRGYTSKLSNHVDDIEQFVKEALADE